MWSAELYPDGVRPGYMSISGIIIITTESMDPRLIIESLYSTKLFFY